MNRLASLMILVIAAPALGQAVVSGLESPAPRGSGQGHLDRGADGHVRLSWIVREGRVATFAFSTFGPEGWSAPKTIARGDDWFVNWADVPSLVAGPHGVLAAHWLERIGEETYAYGVRVVTSKDGGRTWTKPAWLHEDTSPQEHGFCSVRPIGHGRFRAVWLDGRALGRKPREMQLRTRTFDADGKFGPEVLLDRRVCECCPTGLVSTAPGEWTVAYRDRSANEVRDIAFVNSAGDADRASNWTRPASLSADGWERPG